MKKILYIVIALIWILVLVYIGMVYFKSPKADQVQSIRALMTVGENYLDNKPISETDVPGTDGNAEFVKAIAVYMEKLQEIENKVGSETRLLTVTIEPVNLSIPDNIDRNILKVDSYKKSVEDSYAKLETNVNELVARLDKIDPKDTMYNIDDMKSQLGKDKESRDKISKNRLYMAEYVKALLEFMKSRIGYFKVSEGKVTFAAEADQAYYKQLTDGITGYKDEVEKLILEDREQVRKGVSEMKKFFGKGEVEGDESGG